MAAASSDDAFAQAADQSLRCKEKLCHAVFCVLEDEDELLDETSFSRSFANQLAELVWECARRRPCLSTCGRPAHAIISPVVQGPQPL
jgi:hypothetical protein